MLVAPSVANPGDSCGSPVAPPLILVEKLQEPTDSVLLLTSLTLYMLKKMIVNQGSAIEQFNNVNRI